jgi:hypothetical protein
MATRRVTLTESVGSYTAGTTLAVSNVYGSYHMYDYRLSNPDTTGDNVEVTSNMIEESVETVRKG